MKPPDEAARAIVSKWLTNAEDDPAVARHLLAPDTPYSSAAGFHARHAAEKFMKAFLAARQIEFPKTHDLGVLITLIARENTALAASLRPAIILTKCSVETRYPDDLPSLTPEEADEALRLAESARTLIVAALAQAGR